MFTYENTDKFGHYWTGKAYVHLGLKARAKTACRTKFGSRVSVVSIEEFEKLPKHEKCRKCCGLYLAAKERGTLGYFL